MPSITNARWELTHQYLDQVFALEDEALRDTRRAAEAAGFPPIAISPAVGSMLKAMAQLVSAKTIVEAGTLAGYSAIWLARGLAPGGSIRTIETDPKHAAFARERFAAAGLADSVTVVEGTALTRLSEMATTPGSVDLIFLDSDKREYPECLPHIAALLRPGGLLIADNVLGSDMWWIDEPEGSSPSRDAADHFNHALSADERFSAFAVPLRYGLAVAVRR